MVDVRVGDRIVADSQERTSVVGTVTSVNDNYIEVGTLISLYKPDGWDVKILEYAARVGTPFVRGLPNGSVIQMSDSASEMRAMRGDGGWILEIGDVLSDEEILPHFWTIVYLP